MNAAISGVQTGEKPSGDTQESKVSSLEISRLENMIKTLQNDMKNKAGKTEFERLRYEVDGKQDSAQFRSEMRRIDTTVEGHNHQIHDCVLKGQENSREHE